MTNIRICRIPFLTGWRCAWLPQPPPVWPMDSNRSSRKIVTVVQNRKLVTWPEHVLTNKQWQRLVRTRDDCDCGPKSKVGGMTRICSLIIWWTESDRGFPSKLLKPDDRWYNFGKIVTVALRPNLQTWPEYILWSSEQQTMFETVPTKELMMWHEFVKISSLCFHERCSSNDKWQNANSQCWSKLSHHKFGQKAKLVRSFKALAFDIWPLTSIILRVLSFPNWEPKMAAKIIQTFTFARRHLVNANRKQMCCKCTSLRECTCTYRWMSSADCSLSTKPLKWKTTKSRPKL